MIKIEISLATLIITSLLQFNAPAYAQQARPVDTHDTRAYAITVAGAVSLGSYEAGLLYYTRYLLRHQPRKSLSAFTGASAGSVNSLIGLLYTCNDLPENPQDSLFWQTWINIGLNDLYNKDEVTNEAFFTRRVFKKALEPIESFYMNGWEKGCGTSLGITATRKDSIIEEIAPGLTLSRSLENFNVRVEGQGRGQPPKISNIFMPELGVQVALPFNGKAEHDFALLRDVIFASTAFPLAFPAQPIRHCLVKTQKEMEECTDENSKVDDFVDGAVMDNTPIRIAMRLLNNDPNTSKTAKADARYIMITPDATSYPLQEEHNSSQSENESAFGAVSVLAGGFLSTSRTTQLAEFVAEQPDLQNKLLANSKEVPLAGGYLHAFSGFIEKDFRRFDFAAGMNDARRMVMAQMDKKGERKIDLSSSIGQEKLWNDQNWLHYFCLAETIDTLSGDGPSCKMIQSSQKAEDRNFLILLQSSLEILNARCKAIKGMWIRQPLCQKLYDKQGQTPWLLGDSVKQVKSMDLKTSDLDMFFDLLSRYKFEFTDLGLSAAESDEGKRRFREIVGELSNNWTNRQPGVLRLLSSVGAKYGLDHLVYQAPGRIQQFTLGDGGEFWQSHLMQKTQGAWSTLRLGFGLRIRDFSSLWTSQENRVAFTPTVGVDWQPYKLSSPGIQTRITARTGYQLSTGDNFGSDTCNVALSSESSSVCSVWTAGGGLTLSFYELLVLQSTVNFYPHAPANFGKDYDFFIMAGLQLMRN
jgi:hypothetical protein